MDGTGGGREEEAEMPDPQSCSSSNRASMDGTSDGREEKAETPNPHTCSSSNRASIALAVMGSKYGWNRRWEIQTRTRVTYGAGRKSKFCRIKNLMRPTPASDFD